MFLDTIAYALGDLLGLKDKTDEVRATSTCAKVAWLVFLLLFVAYASFAVLYCVRSYQNHSWSQSIERRSAIPYPEVIVYVASALPASALPFWHSMLTRQQLPRGPQDRAALELLVQHLHDRRALGSV